MATTTQRSNSRSRSTGSSAKKRASSAKKRTSPSSSNGRVSSSNSSNGTVVPVVTAVAGATAGVIGGVIFGRKKSRGHFDGLAKNVGVAANNLGKLAGEVSEARKRAEKIGKALS